MRHSLHDHILYLENTIQSHRDRLTKPGLSRDEVLDLELQLTLAESALEHYRQAYALELSVSRTEPPNHSDTGSKDKPHHVKNPNARGKKDGLTVAVRCVRKRSHSAMHFSLSASPKSSAPYARRGAAG